MCRWAAYIGQPILLGDIISHPEHSLIEQSIHATQSVTSTNADGVGVAWYSGQRQPAVFRDILPAWSDRNLKTVSNHVWSGLFLSHVRASSGAPTSRENCHPFSADNWSFVHNGQIGGFGDFRRIADDLIPDPLFHNREGSTDSEVMFLLMLSLGVDKDPKGALERAAGMLEKMSREKGRTPYLHMSVAFSCGERLYAARYSSDPIAPSLFHRWSPEMQGRSVVSEPLNLKSGWEEIPANSFCVFEGKPFDIMPFTPKA